MGKYALVTGGSRGIGREDAAKALDEFFENIDADELCRKALKKVMRTKDDPQKIFQAMMRLGFSSSQIKDALKSADNQISSKF